MPLDDSINSSSSASKDEIRSIQERLPLLEAENRQLVEKIKNLLDLEKNAKKNNEATSKFVDELKKEKELLDKNNQTLAALSERLINLAKATHTGVQEVLAMSSVTGDLADELLSLKGGLDKVTGSVDTLTNSTSDLDRVLEAFSTDSLKDFATMSVAALQLEEAQISKNVNAYQKILNEKKRLGQESGNLEKLLKNEQSALGKVTEALNSKVKASEESYQAMNRSSMSDLGATAIWTTAAYALSNLGQGLSDTSSQHVRYRKELEHSINSVQLSIGYEQRHVDQLLSLKNTLHLTRSEYLEFVKAYSSGAELGIDLASLDKLANKLKDVVGVGKAADNLQALMSGNISGASIEGLAAGDASSRASALRVSNRAQREAISNLDKQTPVEGTSYENTMAAFKSVGDDLRGSLSQLGDKFTGGLGKYLGTSAIPMIQLVATGIASVKQLGMLSSELSEMRKQGTILTKIERNTSISASSSMKPDIGGSVGGGFLKSRLGKSLGLGAGGLLAGGLGLVADSYKDSSEKGTGAHTAASAGSALGNIAGGALSGASIGLSLGGPWGAAIGGVIGGLGSLYSSLDDLSSVWDYAGESMMGLILTQEELNRRTQRRLEQEAALNSSSARVTQSFDDFKSQLSGARGESKEGFFQERGRRLAAGANATITGGGDFVGMLSGIGAGRNSQFLAMGETYNKRSSEINKQKEDLEKSKHLKTPDQYQQDLENILRGEENLQAEMLQDLQVLDLSPVFDMINKKSEIALRSISAEKDIIDAKLGLVGMIAESQALVSDAYLKDTDLLNEQLVQAQKSAAYKKAEMEANKRAIALMRDNATSQESRDLYQQQIDALESDIAYENLKLQKEEELLGVKKAQNAAKAITDIKGTTDTYDMKIRQAKITEVDAGMNFSSTFGSSADDTRSSYNQIIALEIKQLEDLNQAHDRQLVAMDAVITKAQAEYEASLKSGNAKQINANKIALETAEKEKEIAQSEQRTKKLQQETQIRQTQLKKIQESYDKERSVVDTRRSVLEIERETAEFLGASYSQVFSLSQKILDEKVKEYDIARREYAELSKLLEEGKGSAQDQARMQQLQVEMARKQADITKESYGKQRDFLDKSLGKLFGVSSGSRFNPITSDRMMFGEHMKRGDGTSLMGGSRTIEEEERRRGVAGAQRPSFPGTQGIPGQRNPPFGGGAIGQNNIPQPSPIPSVANNPPVKVDVTVAGDIGVTVSLKSDMLSAAVDKRIELSHRRGNS